MNPTGIPWVTRIDEIRSAVRKARERGQVVALVPTMGALHDGHVRLIDEARREAECVVVSIFVNPTQFGPSEDLDRYPRTPDEDRRRCAEGGASLIFAPEPGSMYPPGSPGTFVEVPVLSKVLEGAARPTHFNGVTTVVMKLFQIVGPDLAFFGRKDYQQLAVIRAMVADLNVPVTIRPVDTVREGDGLAMSSRNRYLDPDERKAATTLSRALAEASAAVAAGEQSPDRVRQILRRRIESERLARLDYAEVADPDTLRPLGEADPVAGAVALLAVRFPSARLIDNARLPG
ncbi:MAG: pantoate--beta-alanine ligase [Isosphaeraceae bacterium]